MEQIVEKEISKPENIIFYDYHCPSCNFVMKYYDYKIIGNQGIVICSICYHQHSFKINRLFREE